MSDLRRELFLFLLWFRSVEERRAMLWVIEVPDPGAEERIARVQQLILFCKYIRVTFDSPTALQAPTSVGGRFWK